MKQYEKFLKKKGEEPKEFPDNIDAHTNKLTQKIKEINSKLHDLKIDFKNEINNHNGIRVFRNDYINSSNIISIFESTLTRTLGLQTNEKYEDIIVVRVYYYEILRNLMLDGFMLNGEKFVCFTASAGQIRTKKVVFIKEKLWLQHQGTLMCGLTLDIINKHGGVNVNKYFAYLALCNSATDMWGEFNIKKSIVVDDMETLVTGKVDYLDDKTFLINTQVMDIPISHTDGCGMILTRISKKNFMIRLPWVKGLLASFPFDQFIREADILDPSINHAIVTDIYGKQHDILSEGIEIIFTKSQFKMWKYYDSWEDYSNKYITNGCSAGRCNVEEDYIPKAKLNYQVLQTLHDMTENETKKLSEATIKKIENIASSRKSKLEAFWATKENANKNDFQKCLLMYPELLSTKYVKETLKQIKASMVREGRSGHLFVDCRYLFLIPDLYAFCQWLFLGQKNPTGLLQNGEVCCKLYGSGKKLDCLRSPHLGFEHAVRINKIDEDKRKWFHTSGIYTSCHDLISKILQFDVDGDKSLVCAEELLVSIAERNNIGRRPTYYIMGKAASIPIDNLACYNGMIQAYKGGKIGPVSNDITKIWNREDVDYVAIQRLCAKGNYAIDSAKTLYEPTIPREIDETIKTLTRCKVPHFFIYAKDKKETQVEKVNESVVNRLEKIIPNSRIKDTDNSMYAFDYRVLMNDPSVKEVPVVVEIYNGLYKKYKHVFSSTDDYAPYSYIQYEAAIELKKATGSLSVAVDMLIHYLFVTINSSRQKVFWLCFSDIVLENLKKNLQGSMYCSNCGKRITREAANQKLCDLCAIYQKAPDKVLVCCDCEKKFTIPGVVKNKKRCDDCQAKYIRKRKTEKQREYRK